jgi:molybdopterin-guanine dinucleotide biosynthesis protein A
MTVAVSGGWEGFVLAGGRSSRMGRDKAQILYQGRPLIEHALGMLREAGASLAGESEKIAGSRPDLAAYAPVVEDLHPGCGPLSGIEAALSVSQSELNLFLPVDVPLLPVAFLRWIVERAALTGALATIPTVLGFAQPLCAVYRSELLAPLTAAIERGDLKVMRVVMEASRLLSRPVDLFAVEAIRPIERSWPPEPPLHRWFQNLNRPEDLAAIA